MQKVQLFIHTPNGTLEGEVNTVDNNEQISYINKVAGRFAENEYIQFQFVTKDGDTVFMGPSMISRSFIRVRVSGTPI